MSRILDLILKSTDTWDQALDKVNDGLELFTETLTLSTNSTVDVSSGNGYVVGTLGADYLKANILYGGNSNSNTDLIVLSNVIITNTSILSVNGSIRIGNSTVNSTINSTSYSGTANNSLSLGGTLATSYQLNSTLNANIASYLPLYTGVVNSSSLFTNNLYIGNSTVNSTINSTSYSGTANNSLSLGGILASSYQLNSTLNANIASYLPLYTGIVNSSSLFTNNLYIGNSTVNSTINSTSLKITSIIANSTTGTSGQILASNGTAIYWSDVTGGNGGGGGSGLFNTNLTNSTGYSINSTMSSAFTAPSTAGYRYILYSIHVTNIGGANTSITAELEGGTYANISLATTIPVPKESSVELLKMPKIMQPSDILKMQVSDTTALHATITYEAQQDTKYFGAGIDITTDYTYTDLYTATGNSVIQSILLSNDDGVYDTKARVVWTDGSNNIQGYYCYDLIVPADSTIEILEQAKYLPSGYKLRVYSIGNRLEAIVSGKVI